MQSCQFSNHFYSLRSLHPLKLVSSKTKTAYCITVHSKLSEQIRIIKTHRLKNPYRYLFTFFPYTYIKSLSEEGTLKQLKTYPSISISEGIKEAQSYSI